MLLSLAILGKGVIPITSARTPSTPMKRTFFLDKAVWQLLFTPLTTARRSKLSKSISSRVSHVGNCDEVVVPVLVVVAVVVVDVVVVVVVGAEQEGTSHNAHRLLGSVV